MKLLSWLTLLTVGCIAPIKTPTVAHPTVGLYDDDEDRLVEAGVLLVTLAEGADFSALLHTCLAQKCSGHVVSVVDRLHLVTFRDLRSEEMKVLLEADPRVSRVRHGRHARTAPPVTTSGGISVRPGEALVTLKSGQSIEALLQDYTDVACELLEAPLHAGAEPFFLLAVDHERLDTEAFVARLSADTRVRSAGFNQVIAAD